MFTSFKIVKLSCSGNKYLKIFNIDEGSSALTSSGDLFLWGRNFDNIMGLGNENVNVREPTRVR